MFPVLLNDGSLRIKIGDFGISKSIPPNANTDLRTEFGLAGYTPPEMMGRPESYTNAVDLWSLGCLTYRIICGEDMFCTVEDVYHYKHKALPFPKARLSDTGLSKDGLDFMERLLQVDPQHRPTARDALSCSWFRSEPLGYKLSSRQLERFRNLWDPSTLKLQATLTGHSFSIRSVAFSPDGKHLASGSVD